MRSKTKAATRGSIYGVTTELLPQECTGGPSRQALVSFYRVLERIVQEQRHAHDQAAPRIKSELVRGLLPKTLEPEAPLTVREAT